MRKKIKGYKNEKDRKKNTKTQGCGLAFEKLHGGSVCSKGFFIS